MALPIRVDTYPRSLNCHLSITPGPIQYLYAIDSFPGRIYKMTLVGKVLDVLGKSGRQLGEFTWGHNLACPSDWRAQRLILHPR